ncbi:glycosyltransferase [Leucobacter sp. gxy201]|uniref:glycosyltransferase n=1 Tax=Leucobacter sp. gxy201 TaxID=2957200 RepID=UPI003DA1A9E2
MANPRVAFITVSYGSGEALTEFLESLREFHSAHHPVVVVDNKPDHENVAEIARTFGAAYVPLPTNPGYGAGMNAGAQAVGGDVDAYFYCNPDVVFLEETAESLAAVLTADKRLGSIGPKILNEDGTVYPSARNIPSVSTGIGHALFSKVWKGNPWSRAYQNATEYDSPRPSGWLSGAAVMVRADVNRELDGWDEGYVMHFEDIDLGYRIGRAGYENRFEPSVAIVHSGAHSTKKHAVAVERKMTNSAIRFMSKRYAGALNAPLRWVITAGLRVRGTLKVRAAQRSN